jgi:hypothetical protein
MSGQGTSQHDNPSASERVIARIARPRAPIRTYLNRIILEAWEVAEASKMSNCER